MTVYVVERWAVDEPCPPLAVARTAEGALRVIQGAGFRPVDSWNPNSAGIPLFKLGDAYAEITPYELKD